MLCGLRIGQSGIRGSQDFTESTNQGVFVALSGSVGVIGTSHSCTVRQTRLVDFLPFRDIEIHRPVFVLLLNFLQFQSQLIL